MARITSPVVGRSPLSLTPEEFERRLAAHGHRADEIRRLWDELATTDRGPSGRRELGMGPMIAVYLGLLLVVVACASLVAVYWDELGSSGVLGLAVAYSAGYLVASEIVRRRGLDTPANVLAAVVVAWIALATYAVEALAGVWPEDYDLEWIDPAVTVIAVTGIAAGLLLLALRPSPLLLVPIAIGTALLAVDLAELAFGSRLDDMGVRQAATFVLPLGIAWIASGLWLDATQRRSYATSAHWCGLLLAGTAVFQMIPKSLPGFALVGVLGAISLFFSAFVRHWSFTVVGALGVLLATIASFGEFGRLAPIIAALAGLALIFVGLRWSSWRDSIRDVVLAHMSASARRLVERIAP